MDVTTVTIDQFFQLEIPHHKEALRVFDAAINPLIEQLAGHADKATPAYDAERDRLCILLTLRKIHEARLLDLLSDAENMDSQPLQQAA
jgi:hypothetical protein